MATSRMVDMRIGARFLFRILWFDCPIFLVFALGQAVRARCPHGFGRVQNCGGSELREHHDWMTCCSGELVEFLLVWVSALHGFKKSGMVVGGGGVQAPPQLQT